MDQLKRDNGGEGALIFHWLMCIFQTGQDGRHGSVGEGLLHRDQGRPEEEGGWWPPGTDCSWSPQVEEIKNNDPHFKPGLVIVQVKTSLGSFGANPVSSGSLSHVTSGGREGRLKCLHQDEAQGSRRDR